MQWIAPLIGAVAIIASAVFVWAVFVERNRFILRQYAVKVLPTGAKPIRVLHISDMHLAPWQARKSRWISQLSSVKPDLIVMTGDSMGHTQALPIVEHTLQAFAGIPGVFVFGSNDYHGPRFKNPFLYFLGPSRVKSEPVKLDIESQRNFLTRGLGWLDLNNATGRLSINGNQLLFGGVDDPHHKLDDITAVASQLQREYNTQQTVIGVSHAPYRRVLNAFVEKNSRVIFTGHTHGGQICTPWFSPIVTNCDVPRSHARGYSRWFTNSQHAELFVSAGLGTSIYAPVRLFCRPEAALVTLEAQ